MKRFQGIDPFLGAGSDVFDFEHPPCIRKLMLYGAPTDQEYVQANDTIGRYVISVGLTAGDVHFNYLLYAVALGEQKLEREGGNSRRGIPT
jgi:hypothetical protein